MARPRTTTPAYRLHKATGLGVCTIEGRDFYLGKHGTEESRERFERLVTSWRAHGLPRQEKPVVQLQLTVGSLVARYLAHVEAERLYWKHGKPTAERLCMAVALRPLVRLFASKVAAEFGPADLLTVRNALCEPLPPPAAGESKLGRWHTGPIVRTSVNRHVDRIRRVFQWATMMQLVPATTWQALLAVPGMRRGQSDRVRESEPVLPVGAREVAVVLRRVRPLVAGMIRMQWLTGMRPGEVVQMRMRDIDRKADVWVFRPLRHKGEHLGKVREVMIGPKAQRVLEPFFRADPEAPMFPLHTSNYREAIREACREAGIEPWAPNRLRHAAGTRFRRALGIESARVALGHNDAGTTLIYAERDRRAAVEVARLHG